MVEILSYLIAFLLGLFVNLCLFPYLLEKVGKLSIMWIDKAFLPITIHKIVVWTTAFVIAFAVAMLICDKRVQYEKENIEKEYIRKVDSLKSLTRYPF